MLRQSRPTIIKGRGGRLRLRLRGGHGRGGGLGLRHRDTLKRGFPLLLLPRNDLFFPLPPVGLRLDLRLLVVALIGGFLLRGLRFLGLPPVLVMRCAVLGAGRRGRGWLGRLLCGVVFTAAVTVGRRVDARRGLLPCHFCGGGLYLVARGLRRLRRVVRLCRFPLCLLAADNLPRVLIGWLRRGGRLWRGGLPCHLLGGALYQFARGSDFRLFPVGCGARKLSGAVHQRGAAFFFLLCGVRDRLFSVGNGLC